MLRHALSPFRVFCGSAAIAIALLFYFTLNPNLKITPIATSDPAAAYGTVFDLRNGGITKLHNVSSSYCLNSFSNPAGAGPVSGITPGTPNSAPAANSAQSAAPNATNYGVLTAGVEVGDLDHGDTVALPLQSPLSGPLGSQVDLVFVVRFQPGWWFDLVERRFRFQGTEGEGGTWTWRPLPLGSACG